MCVHVRARRWEDVPPRTETTSPVWGVVYIVSEKTGAEKPDVECGDFIDFGRREAKLLGKIFPSENIKLNEMQPRAQRSESQNTSDPVSSS